MKILSVIVPVYNIEKYVGRCLTSIIQQDFDDMEIIVVNDGSTDGSIKIVQEIATKDKRIKIIDKVNGGLSSARNAGLRIAQGKYVLHIDGDDWIEPGYLNDVCSLAEREDLDIVVTDIYLDWDDGRLAYKKDFWSMTVDVVDAKKYMECFFLRSYPVVWNKLFKRMLYVDNAVCHPEYISVGEDLATTPRLISYANRIGKIDKAYVHYIQRGDSIIRGTKARRIYEELLKVKECLQDFFAGKEPEGFKEWQMEILYNAIIKAEMLYLEPKLYDLCKKYKFI